MAFLTALVLAVAAIPALDRVATRLGLVDAPDHTDLKIHERPIPLVGGLAVALSVLVAGALFGRVSPWLAAAIAVACLVGAADDAKPVSAGVRTGALVLGAALTIPVFDSTVWIGVLNVFLAVACANAVNIIDGQDGLAGGLGLVAAAAFGVVHTLEGHADAALMGFVLCGALVGFLIWNRPPARVFLGDSGAYTVGFLLATLAAWTIHAWGLSGILSAGLFLGVFLFEVCFTFARRLHGPEGLTRGDRLHSYDLMARAIGRGRSTALFCVAGGVSASLGVVVLRTNTVFATAAILLAVIASVAVGVRFLHEAKTSPNGIELR